MVEGGADGHLDVLVEHARRALVRHIGATKVDVWLGKDGLVHHDVADLAVVVVDALRPVLTTPEARRCTTSLHADGVIAGPLTDHPNDW